MWIVDVDNLQNYLDIVLKKELDALISKSYYLIQEGSHENTFTSTEDVVAVTITVPVGAYLLSAFRTTIGTLLSNASPNGHH